MRFKKQKVTIISEDTRFEGTLETPGALVVLGSLEGSIKSKTLEVCKGGKAIGSIEAVDVTISGYFEGELICHNVLTIAKSAEVKGRLAYGTLAVESGGLIEAEIFQLESMESKLVPFHAQKAQSEGE
jgi:cytoskeletal protein CcmA (bactofilin family)